MSEPWWSDNYDGPCQWADRDPSNKPWCELHQSWGSIDAHACWFAALTDRAEKAEAQVQRVRELHAPCLDPEVHNGDRCCLVCSDHGRRGEYTLWPCPTIRALGGDGDE